jgi:hypothetical protein
MKIRSNVKAGGLNTTNHNEKMAKSFVIKTGVKAGGLNTYNHNEKLESDINPIEQKKNVGKKLRLGKETIKVLKDGDLKPVAGGRLYSEWRTCSQNSCIGCNHNEKLMDDNSRLIEQKKNVGKKLRLGKETIRALTDSDLMKAIGGVQTSHYTKGASGPEDGNTTC